MGLINQFLCTGIICAMGINLGFMFVWPATTITLFASENTTLSRPMTDTEISLFGSLSSVGALCSTLCSGFILDKLGRKKCCILISICLVLFWTILIACRQVEMVLAAMFLSGISSAIFLVASVYISEICQESIRGSMTSSNMIGYGIGSLFIYLLGGYLSYDMILYIGLTMTVTGTMLLFILKDSPIFLMQIGKEKEAAQAIAFYKNLKIDDKEVLEEMNSLRRALNSELDESTPEYEKLKMDLNSERPAKKLSFWQFMRKSKSTRRAFMVNLVVITAAIFQGLFVVQMYIEPLFTEAMPEASFTVCSVIMAAIGIVAGVVAAFLTDVSGRRPLMIFGSAAAGISCIILGTQFQFHWGPNWITAVFIYVFALSYTFGAGTVPYVLLAELYLPEVKSIVSMLVIEWGWLCNFFVLFIINPLLKALGWGPIFYIFATTSFLTAAFCVFFLPETKGLNVNEIQPLFAKNKSRNDC